MVNADYLFLMTDVDCLYTNNPRTDPDAKPIEVVEDISSLTVDGIAPSSLSLFPGQKRGKQAVAYIAVSSAGSSLGTGGMSTKLTAARLATSAGVTTIITRASTPSNIFHIVAYVESIKMESAGSSPALSRNTSSAALHNLVNPQDPVATSTLYSATQLSAGLPQTSASTTTTGNAASGAAVLPRQHPLHTRFVAKPRALRDRHFWILHGLKPHGTVVIDEGAYRALTRRDKAGLLPVGVLDVQGTFAQQECVRVQVARPNQEAGESGYTVMDAEVGRAVVNYTSLEIARIKGQKSSRIHDLLGYAGMSSLPNACAGAGCWATADD